MSLEEQVAQWFRQWRDPIYRYLVAAGGNPAAADEITQESFLRLYQMLHEGKKVANPQFWLYRVAHNLLVDLSRSGHAVASSSALSAETAAEFLLDTTPNPEQIAMYRERLRRVHLSIQSLTQMQRNCLYLRAEGFFNREIAQILGIGMSSVADALHRALKRLAKEDHE